MSNRPIDIHIDQLILHGIDPRDGERIADETRRQLAHLITSHGLPPHWAEGDIRLTPNIEIPTGTSAARIGETIAATIYRGVK
ncbi:MAG: hypothetical protein AAGC55_07445 [Myxococcota bacterium]